MSIAFIIEVFARFIVGLEGTKLGSHRLCARCTGATRSAPGKREGELIHHSGRGVQYLSIRYSEAGIELSAGSVGDPCDNALA